MKKNLLLAFLLFFCCLYLNAQTLQIKGRVFEDSTAAGLSNVSVVASDTKKGVSTDKDGNFSLTVTGRSSVTLQFTYVGYRTQTITTNGSSSVIVNLKREQASAADEVVVIGYATVRRRDLTGSVSSVGAKQLRDIPINSASQALAGRLAGVQVTGAEGSPNADVIIRVRGGGSITQDNSPLYIIDGVQVENGLNLISPQDIESVDVLKDASTTSIYGARGANGVVIITTKSGTRNNKTTISYNGFAGIRSLANKLDVMKPYDFVLYQYERTRGTDSSGFAQTYGTTWDTLQNYKNVPFVDWQKQLFGRQALMQTHNVSLSGGNAITQYNLSLSSNTEKGIMQNSDFDRKIVTFKLDNNFTPAVKIGFTTRFNNTNVNGAGTSNAGSSSVNNLRQAIKYRPMLVKGQGVEDYDPDYALETSGNSLSLVNPILLNQAQYRNNVTNNLNLSGYVNWDITKFLSFRSTLGYDMTNTRQNSFDDTLTTNAKTYSKRPVASINTLTRGTIDNSNVLTFSNSKINGDFNKKNSINLLLGHEVYQYREKDYYIETRFLPLGISSGRALGNMNLGDPSLGSEPQPTSLELPSNLLSFFSRLNYSYDNKYLLTLSVRADGSTKFSDANKWGYFPSGSVAWRISNEKFMKNLKPVVNDLKLRVSYGQSGNNRIGDFLYLTQFTTNTRYGLNDQTVPGFVSPSLANNNLKWETTISRNVGLDASLFRNKIQLSVDVYKNTTKDLLINVPIAPQSGYTTQLQNVGSTSNKGVEIQLSATPVQNKNFTWSANFNISFNKNRVEKLSQFQKFYYQNSGWSTNNDYIVRVGDPVGSMYGYVTDGFYAINDFDYNTTSGVYTLKAGNSSNQSITAITPQPGGLKFKDINGDGVVNTLDETIIGDANPKAVGGLNQQFSYKNFDLSVFVNYQIGNDVYNANKIEFTSGYTPNSNLLAIMNDRWRTVDATGKVLQKVTVVNGVQTVTGVSPAELAQNNTGAKLWIPLTTSTSFIPHSWAIEDGSFLRLNNVTLGYTFPVSMLKKIRVDRLRVYATLNNIAVLTKYSGYDPEVSTRRSVPTTPGVDYSAYPRSRSYIFGVNLSF